MCSDSGYLAFRADSVNNNVPERCLGSNEPDPQEMDYPGHNDISRCSRNRNIGVQAVVVASYWSYSLSMFFADHASRPSAGEPVKLREVGGREPIARGGCCECP